MIFTGAYAPCPLFPPLAWRLAMVRPAGVVLFTDKRIAAKPNSESENASTDRRSLETKDYTSRMGKMVAGNRTVKHMQTPKPRVNRTVVKVNA